LTNSNLAIAKIDSEKIFDVRISQRKDFDNISHLSILSEAKNEGIVIYTN